MRIIGGEWRGTTLAGLTGDATRPTADRLRQATFDILMHASWGGRQFIEGTNVLDGFAGTGALGLEALSRGAPRAVFIERDKAALTALRSNVTRCRVETRATILARDLFSLHPAGGDPSVAAGLVFLDPPYRADLVPRAVTALRAGGWLAPGAVIVAETARDEDFMPPTPALAERVHGVARVTVWRDGPQPG